MCARVHSLWDRGAPAPQLQAALAGGAGAPRSRQMDEAKEAMAQALFKSWFVDFDPVIDNALKAGNPIPEQLAPKAAARKALGKDRKSLPDDVQRLFPSSFVETEEMGWVPEGWEIRELQDVASLIIDHRGKTPKKLGGDWQESGYPAVSAKNIKNRKLIRKDALNYVDQKLYSKWMQEELRAGDVLLTSEAPLGEMYYLSCDVKWVLSQRLLGIRADSKVMTGIYLFNWLNTDTAEADIQGRASGTTVQGIKQSELRQVKVLCPSKHCLSVFTENLLPLMEKQKANDDSIDELQTLRDTLLPELMSGKLTMNGVNQ
ncbi:MAG: restriction endonuclease subunit S [Deltaproteobacteria bacterium]|nr:restriction endonuclease subunit S [Deltaproteobacteria bacterium]